MKFSFIFIGLLGLSRMLFWDMPYTPFELIAPKPSVFLNSNYYRKFQLVLYTKNGHLILDPFKDHSRIYRHTRLSSYYPLIRVVDRPDLTSQETWRSYIFYFFCMKKGSALSTEIFNLDILAIESLVSVGNNQWKKVQFLRCAALKK